MTAAYMTDPYTLSLHAPISRAMVDRIYTPAERHAMIELAAYYRAELRGFAPGRELEDWLAAEHEIDELCGLAEPHPNWDSPNRGA